MIARIRSYEDSVSGIVFFVALIKENLEIIWRSFLNEKCTLMSLVYGCKIGISIGLSLG